MSSDPQAVTAYRRGRFLLAIVWVGCLALGPYLIFESGSYFGQAKAYREEHANQLYYRAQRDRLSGVEAYAVETGQASSLAPPHLQELQSSEEVYFSLVFVWAWIVGGVWQLRQNHMKEYPAAYE
jgi:hypothetical protein